MSRASSARSTKRKRKDDDTTSDGPAAPIAGPSTSSVAGVQFERDAEFWLDDGNLVLIARNTGFRIYRGLLAAQSEVFRDMFASSSPSTGECHDGCPVVYMSDSPEDLRRLLRVILPTTRRMFFPDDENQVDVSFNQVSAIVRLAHKYNIADLEGQAFSALKAYYTDSFDEHESAGFHSQVSFDDVHAIGAVNYARLANRLEILPYALYACCALRGDIAYGWEREDGTVEHLSQEDLKHCLDGRDALAREAMRLLPKVFVSAAPDACELPLDCCESLSGVMQEVAMGDDAGSYAIFSSREGVIQEATHRYFICALCEKLAIERDREERENVWKRLPQLFGLEIEGWGSEE